MINCLVIDDEQHAIEVLTHYIAQTGSLNLVAGCDNPVQALQWLREHPVDLIFLDIHMPQLSGLDLARMIGPQYKVVLCTAYPDYALQGFELDVLDYLVKPIPFPRFLKTVQRAVDHFHSAAAVAAAASLSASPSGGSPTGASGPSDPSDDFILVKTGVRGSMNKINIHDIRYAEGMKNYVAIHHGVEKTLALLSMKELEERLPAQSFMRVHKSFIVSIPHISAIEGNEILLRESKTRVLLGESYRTRFFEAMKGKLIGRP